MNDSHKKQTLGEYLRAARTAAGLSIRELARLADVGHPYIVKLENGQKTNPTAEILQRLADVLELDVGELLAYIGVKPASTLPPAKVYFRRKYGLSEADSEDFVRLLDEFSSRKMQNPTNPFKGGEHDEGKQQPTDG